MRSDRGSGLLPTMPRPMRSVRPGPTERRPNQREGNRDMKRSVRRAITAGELRAFKLRGQLRVSEGALTSGSTRARCAPGETSARSPRRACERCRPGVRGSGQALPFRGSVLSARAGMSVKIETDAAGKRRYKVRWRYAGRRRARRFGRAKDARSFDARVTHARQLGELHLLDSSDTTVDAYAAEYWDRHVVRLAARTQTAHGCAAPDHRRARRT